MPLALYGLGAKHISIQLSEMIWDRFPSTRKGLCAKWTLGHDLLARGRT